MTLEADKKRHQYQQQRQQQQQQQQGLLPPPLPPPVPAGPPALSGPRSKKRKHDDNIRRDERARITRVIEEMGHDISALPERFQRELGVPQLRSNLTPAQKLRLTKLDGEWAAAKQEREAAHQRRKEAKAAWEDAKRAWVEADKRVKAVSAERRLFFEEQD